MASRFTTIVSVVSPRASEIVTHVESDATNVSAVRLDDIEAEDAAARRRLAWSEALRRRNVYTLVDFDPFEPLVAAWVDRLQGSTDALDPGAGLVDIDGMAEYVLVTDDVEGERRHWYHGLLRSFASPRVVMVKPHPEAVLHALAHLRSAPAFPPLDAVVRAAGEYVPTGLSTTADTSRLIAEA